ncbi:MAG: twin-arginine translocation signal domain-containing protein [Pirellulales bacterium]
MSTPDRSDVSSSDAAANASRREFLKTSGVVAAGAVAGSLSIARSAHAAGSDVLKIGLVGCGGRGTGAALQALKADKNVKLVALGDVFPEGATVELGQLEEEQRGRAGRRADRAPVRRL